MKRDCVQCSMFSVQCSVSLKLNIKHKFIWLCISNASNSDDDVFFYFFFSFCGEVEIKRDKNLCAIHINKLAFNKLRRLFFFSSSSSSYFVSFQISRSHQIWAIFIVSLENILERHIMWLCKRCWDVSQ